MLRANFHTHSTFCDGTSTPRQMVERAMALGFEALGFSGHVDLDPVMDVAAYAAEIRRLEAEYAGKLEILCGGEVDRLYPSKEGLRLDYIIGSSHHIELPDGRIMPVDDTEEKFLRLLNEGFGGDIYAMTTAYYEGVARVYDDTGCDFVGHFDLITKYNNHLQLIVEDDPRYVNPAMDAMDALAAKGMRYFEINTRMSGKGRIYPHRRLLEHLKALAGEILINSDAHNARELDQGFEAAVALARRCGFDHTNYLTKKDGRTTFIEIPI